MQKFSQIYLKKLKNSKITPKKIKNTNSQKFKQSPKFCHTERSEVSTNSKCEFALLYKAYLKFYGFFATLKMTKSPKISAPQTKIPPNFFQTPKKISPKISVPQTKPPKKFPPKPPNSPKFHKFYKNLQI